MPYSLTFDSTKNTWTDWGLIPESPPTIEPPSPKTNFVEIPGRTAGPIDLSKQPWGKLLYERSSGSWSFIKVIGNQNARTSTYEAIRYWLHGRTCTVKLEEDALHYYMGMFTVGQQQIGPNTLRVTIGYSLEPVRYNVNGSVDSTYVNNYSSGG